MIICEGKAQKTLFQVQVYRKSFISDNESGDGEVYVYLSEVAEDGESEEAEMSVSI